MRQRRSWAAWRRPGRGGLEPIGCSGPPKLLQAPLMGMTRPGDWFRGCGRDLGRIGTGPADQPPNGAGLSSREDRFKEDPRSGRLESGSAVPAVRLPGSRPIGPFPTSVRGAIGLDRAVGAAGYRRWLHRVATIVNSANACTLPGLGERLESPARASALVEAGGPRHQDRGVARTIAPGRALAGRWGWFTCTGGQRPMDVSCERGRGRRGG
jgi:hypothetical protein